MHITQRRIFGWTTARRHQWMIALAFILMQLAGPPPVSAGVNDYSATRVYYWQDSDAAKTYGPFGSYGEAAGALYAAWVEPSYWPDSEKADWGYSPNYAQACGNHAEPTNTNSALIHILVLWNGTAMCVTSYDYVSIQYTCPYGGSLVNGTCFNAPPCPNGQTRSSTGKCGPSPKNLGGCDGKGAFTSNPINIGTGNKYFKHREYGAEHTYFDTVERHYNSQADKIWNVGANWRVVGAVETVSATSAKVVRPDFRTYVFTLLNNQWVGDADVQLKLTRLTDGAGNPTGWQLVTEDGAVETYNLGGSLTSKYNRAGLGFTREKINGNFVLIDSVGRSLVLNYGPAYYESLTDPAGEITRFTYDANGNLATVTYPDGAVRQYHYENATYKNALTGITDENNVRHITYTYDADGNTVREVLAGGAGGYSLNFGTNSTIVTDPRGTQYTYNFQTILGKVNNTGASQPAGSGCGPAAEAVSYDAHGNVASRSDFNGRKTTYAYDNARNLEIRRTEGMDGTGAVLPETRTVVTAWHATWRLPVQIDEYAGATASGNPLRSTRIAYDDRGNVTSRSLTDVATGVARTWTTTYTYSAALPGLILQKVEDGPRMEVADTVTTEYYPHDAACAGAALGTGRDKGCRGQVQRITDALGHVTQYTRYNAHGQAEEIIDPNGVTTTLTYDLRLRLTSRSTAGETTRLQYDPVGQLTRLTLPDGNQVSYTYDGAHRLTAVADNQGNSIVYTLDAAGNRTREDVLDPQGALVKTLSRSYDALNRLQTLTGIAAE